MHWRGFFEVLDCPSMDRVARAEIRERIRLLDQTAKDFPDTMLAVECHYLIRDVARHIGAQPDLVTELARATSAAAHGKTSVVCSILLAVMTEFNN